MYGASYYSGTPYASTPKNRVIIFIKKLLDRVVMMTTLRKPVLSTNTNKSTLGVMMNKTIVTANKDVEILTVKNNKTII
jgi:hypothetical protein